MINLNELKEARLKRTEASLKLAGAVKCSKCGVWVDKSFIIEAGACNECIDKSKAYIRWLG
jgi:hypothetical protein